MSICVSLPARLHVVLILPLRHNTQPWCQAINDQTLSVTRRIRRWTRNRQQQYGAPLQHGRSEPFPKRPRTRLADIPTPGFYFRFNQLTQGIYITLPYTLAVYMVRHFEANRGNEESIGRNTGLLVRLFRCSVLCLPPGSAGSDNLYVSRLQQHLLHRL